MASPSKEETILTLILEHSPLKEWHFEEIVREIKMTKAVANKWLKKYVSEGLLHYVKKKGRFPFYTVGAQNPVYYSYKKIFILQKLHESGLMSKLISLSSAKTVVVFGSTVKGDWYKDSDIDIFVFGDASHLRTSMYERKIGKRIEFHVFRDISELHSVKSGLLKNVANGYFVKGQIQDFAKVS